MQEYTRYTQEKIVSRQYIRYNETRFSLRRTEEIYMSKKYYPIEDAVNNVSQKFKLGLKDANEMDEEEFNNVEEYILKYVKFEAIQIMHS